MVLASITGSTLEEAAMLREQALLGDKNAKVAMKKAKRLEAATRRVTGLREKPDYGPIWTKKTRKGWKDKRQQKRGLEYYREKLRTKFGRALRQQHIQVKR